MKTRPLIETNPYLQDPVMREKLIARSVRSSCGVEGIVESDCANHIGITNRRDKRIYHMLEKKLAQKR